MVIGPKIILADDDHDDDDDDYHVYNSGSAFLVVSNRIATVFGSFEYYKADPFMKYVANNVVEVYNEYEYGQCVVLITTDHNALIWTKQGRGTMYVIENVANELKNVYSTKGLRISGRYQNLGLLYKNGTFVVWDVNPKSKPSVTNRVDDVVQVLDIPHSPFIVLRVDGSIVVTGYFHEIGRELIYEESYCVCPPPTGGWKIVPSGGGGIGISNTGLAIPVFQLFKDELFRPRTSPRMDRSGSFPRRSRTEDLST